MGKVITSAVLITTQNVIFELYFFVCVLFLQCTVTHHVNMEELVYLKILVLVLMDLLVLDVKQVCMNSFRLFSSLHV